MYLQVGNLPRSGFRNRDVFYAVMTRFDVRLLATGAEKAKDREAWTARRAEAFRRWCLPSVLNLCPRPHAWIVLFDRDLTEATAGLLAELAPHAGVYPVLTGDDWRADAVEGTRLASEVAAVDDLAVIACARLDSDDALHRRFFGALDTAVARIPIRSVAINFPYALTTDGEKTRVTPRPNHFFATVEPAVCFRGPCQISHTRIGEVMPVVDVLTDYPMGLYRVHPDAIGGARVPPGVSVKNRHEALGWFGLTDHAEVPSTISP